MEAAAESTSKEITDNTLPQNSNDDKSPTPSLPDITKKSKKDERTRKDDRNVEQFMKSLNSLPSFEEKLSLACKKYVQAADDIKKLQFYYKQSEKRHALMLKEKEHLQQEFNKTILVKSKLENLCRELQKQNKAIKEESLLKIREEEERRKETQAKFQNTLSEITALLQQNNEKNAKLRDDNISMGEKFNTLVQQCQLREQQVDKMAKQMGLESQLSDAKLQKASLEHQAEKERLSAEMEQLKVTLIQYRAKIMELQNTETALKSQLAVYTDKYDEFQNALVKSNQVFGGFKEQMEMMSKRIKKLEKESLSWKKRWETSQTALLDMCGERQIFEERAAAAGRQLHHMQSLCRTLQAERTVLLNTLKDNNIERPPLPVPPPAPPAPAPAPSNTKVDAMVANCAQLRQSLAHLQSQLNVLTINKNGAKEETPVPEIQKKNKSKKSKAQKQSLKDEKDEKTDLQKEPECYESNAAKESTTVSELSANEIEDRNENDSHDTVVQNEINSETSEEKIDDKTMENIIQAINMANMSICSLEVIDVDNEVIIDESDKGFAVEVQVEDKSVIPLVEILQDPTDVPSVENNFNDVVSDIEVKPFDVVSPVAESLSNIVPIDMDIKSVSNEHQ